MTQYKVINKEGVTYITVRLDVVGYPTLWQSILLWWGKTIKLNGCQVTRVDVIKED